jgi:hypothetical protein
VSKTATLFGDSRATVSKAMLAYEDNSGQESTLAEKDRQIILHREGLLQKITELLQHG